MHQTLLTLQEMDSYSGRKQIKKGHVPTDEEGHCTKLGALEKNFSALRADLVPEISRALVR